MCFFFRDQTVSLAFFSHHLSFQEKSTLELVCHINYHKFIIRGFHIVQKFTQNFFKQQSSFLFICTRRSIEIKIEPEFTNSGYIDINHHLQATLLQSVSLSPTLYVAVLEESFCKIIFSSAFNGCLTGSCSLDVEPVLSCLSHI